MGYSRKLFPMKTKEIKKGGSLREISPLTVGSSPTCDTCFVYSKA